MKKRERVLVVVDEAFMLGNDMKILENRTRSSGKKAITILKSLRQPEKQSKAGKTMIELRLRLSDGKNARTISDYLLPETPEKLRHAASACGLLDKYDHGSLADADFRGKRGRLVSLWFSHELLTDKRLVLCEAAIDALSHAVLFPDENTRYASIGGKPSPQQLELIRAAIARMPVDSEIVSAMDNDAEGAKLAEIVKRAVELSGRHDLRFLLQEPLGFKD